MESSMESPQKLEIELSYDPVIPLLGTYPTERNTGYSTDTCTPMLIAHYSQQPSSRNNPGALQLMNGSRNYGKYAQWSITQP
jgi:hypothetical protein